MISWVSETSPRLDTFRQPFTVCLLMRSLQENDQERVIPTERHATEICSKGMNRLQ